MTENFYKKTSHGFTLVEILVALVISSILAISIYNFFIGQHHAYTVQDQVIEMEQNARAAMDLIRRDLRMAGYHAMGDELLANLSTVLPTDCIPNAPLPVNLGNNPVKITKGTATESDMLTFLSVVSTSTNPTVIVEDAEAGTDEVTLNLTYSDAIDQFRIKENEDDEDWDIFHLGVGSDYAKVTGISSKDVEINGESKTKAVLQFEVIPKPNSGGATGLSKKYPAGSPIGEIYVVSYAVFQEDDGKSVLKRKRNAGGFDPVAENITKMKIDLDQTTGEILLSLISRTDRPDHKFQPNNGYRTYTANSRIKMRNINVEDVDVGTDCPIPDAPATVSLAGLDETRPCGIDITWDAVTVSETDCEVTGYKVFYSTNSSGFYDGSVDVGNVTTYTLDVTGLNACTYYIAVAAVNSAGTGAKSAVKDIPDLLAPEAPIGFSADNINGVERKVLLSWDKNTECDLQGYNIERVETGSGEGFEQVNNSIISRELDTYTDIAFSTPVDIDDIDCATYSYRIQAADYCFPSSWSAEVTAAPTAPAPPTGPIFETDGAIDKLSWTLSTDDFIGLNGLNYIKGYHVEYTAEDGSPVVVTLDAGTPLPWTSTSSNSYYEVSAFDACGNVSEKLSFSSVCIDTLPVIAITAPSENDSVSGTETISGTATAVSGRTISKVRLKIDDTEWVDVNVTDTGSWSYDWNTRGEAEGAHTIIIGAEDSNGCYVQASVSVSVSNADVVIGDLECKLFGCGGTDEYAYLLTYVFDATTDLPVSDAAIRSDVAVGPNFYELLPTNELGYYGGDLTPPCTMETDDHETPITNNIAVKTQQKFRSGTITVTVKKDDQEDTCSWTLLDGSAQ